MEARSTPLLIFDGACGFCRIWIEYWKQLTRDRVAYAPYQEAAERFPQIPRQDFQRAIQLVRPDGSFTSGASAAFETLGLRRWYDSSRVLASVSEAAYRLVARHRDFFYQVTRFTFGLKIEPSRFAATQWIFLRCLAVIYGIAFASLAVQVTGLIGERGITPASQFLGRIAAGFGAMRFIAVPTLFWINASDPVLEGAAIVGVALAALLFFGYVERLALALLFVLYLSFSVAGQEFLSFQWDALLLETGFLAIFFGRSGSGLLTVAWLYRALDFRLYFLSGFVKLSSHDPTWRNLTALEYHYHTQPLPNIVAWYMDKLPDWFQRASAFSALAVELVAPFLIFAPRRLRMAGAYALLGLQALIFVTGNFAFFNLLAAAITLFLFDDQALRRFVPGRVREGAVPAMRKPARAGAALLAVLILTLGVTQVAASTVGAPQPLNALVQLVGPYQIVNSYGLFRVMTTTRPEIILEGSDDGETWIPYEFRYKPGDLSRAPRWVEPHQPRLDWQMWFAALEDYQSNPWFVGLVLRLLEGSPEVTALLQSNPFPQHPPRFIRAMSYSYTFTGYETHRRTGRWWNRSPIGIYLPPVGLKNAAGAR